jgi:diacylglycerol kinase (ATP)
METPTSFGFPLVILNPAADRGNTALHRALVQAHTKHAEAEYMETERQGHACELARLAASEGRPIVVVGGDGTVHEVVNGILSAGKRVPFGIVGAGSGNDYAWNTLNLPRIPAAALEVAFNGMPTPVDAGVMNGTYFANSFSVGLDADIAVAANWMKKIPTMGGSRLYYSATLKQLFFGYYRCPWLKVSIDGEEQNAQFKRYVLAAITIGPAYGAGFRINPKASYSDGLFDVCAIDYASLPRALQLLPVVQKGQHEALPEVSFYKAQSVHIESQKAVNFELDGETGSATSFEANILPGVLSVRM